MRILNLSCLMSLWIGVEGWVTITPSRTYNSISSSSSLLSSKKNLYTTTTSAVHFSTATPTEGTTTDTNVGTDQFEPEYAKGYEMIEQQLSANIPDSMKKSSSTSSSSMVSLLLHFGKEYMMACQHANHAVQAKTTMPSPNAPTDAISSAQRFIKGVLYGFKYGLPNSPQLYKFDVSHVALDGKQESYDGIDFYQFGSNFFRPVMDLKSVETNVLYADTHIQQIQEQLNNGENVIFFANHQSEADPQVVSACFELAGYSEMAAQCIYVAGHKVTTDPLAIPFSMGRNLICIHSKKHIDADPETKPMKQKQNLKAMNALLSSLKEESGTLIWVAPSGGRDRRNVETNTVPIAPFDSKTIDMFRLMGNKSKKPTHYYTMAMVSYDLCPPPDFVVAGTGESRNVRFSPVGIAVGAELESVGGLESRLTFCTMAQHQCEADYQLLQQKLF
jgi:glycerol-3-phosphate O-acyltransferase